ncbi:DEAD/DEAH box helicase [Agromyces sp. Marseille-Q5079]|uniref:DEAD/DEAH box helicase n=1 Tax=Agromyces sp. Marseille-Q5079 TaxID=3439059 RepID=UPI003D9CB78A
MDRQELATLRSVVGEASLWATRTAEIWKHRRSVIDAAEQSVGAIRAASVPVDRDGRRQWTVIPLRAGDATYLGHVARAQALPGLDQPETQVLDQLRTPVPEALSTVKALFGVRRMFAGQQAKASAEAAAKYLSEFWAWGRQTGVSNFLERLDDRAVKPYPVDPSSALLESVGLAARIHGDKQMLPPTVLDGLGEAIQLIDRTVATESEARTQALRAGTALRQDEANRMVADMSVERIKEATRERIRLTPLTDAGIRTVRDVLAHAAQLSNLPGIGPTTAQRIVGAANTIWQATFDEMPVRIDVTSPSAWTRELVGRLAAWDATRRTIRATDDLAWAQSLAHLGRIQQHNLVSLMLIEENADRIALERAIDAVKQRARSISSSAAPGGPFDPWQDFLSRPADYFAMLHELGFVVEDEDAVAGGLPDEIVAAVREFELVTDHLTASLRGYQSFGARFALVQRKVVVGDEMGLGKTIEALAVFAHLRAKGAHHGIVVCPAAVVTNWTREIATKSTLRGHRLHGSGRDAAVRAWIAHGGVAVTTYESLAWLESHLDSVPELGCAVFDEAHYIKNPSALRSRRSQGIIARAERAILLTGTPLENRVEEFRNLVSYIRPDLLVDATDLRPRLFRQQVAPAYLRRNQEDVLTELPDLVEVDEWLPMSRSDAAAYRDAVFVGNFQAMRQAAMSTGSESEKLSRLIEIVQEAEDNNRKVIVFSNFLNVLQTVAAALPGRVIGPLTGSVPAEQRQRLVDDFSSAKHGAVLVAQIIAGGVGLNIQAASVVVICEPQLKPTIEWQAIARAHRMGQLDSVQVHRLLSEEGVDVRVTQILAKKKELFAEFAKVSEMADAAPEALDVSEADLVKEVLEAERQRLFAGQFGPGA